MLAALAAPVLAALVLAMPVLAMPMLAVLSQVMSMFADLGSGALCCRAQQPASAW